MSSKCKLHVLNVGFNRDLKIAGQGRVPVRVFRTEHAHKVWRPTFFEVRVHRTENSYS